MLAGDFRAEARLQVRSKVDSPYMLDQPKSHDTIFKQCKTKKIKVISQTFQLFTFILGPLCPRHIRLNRGISQSRIRNCYCCDKFVYTNYSLIRKSRISQVLRKFRIRLLASAIC